MEMKDHREEAILIQSLTKIMEILMANIFHYALRLNWALMSAARVLPYSNYKSNYGQLWKQGGETGKGSLDI